MGIGLAESNRPYHQLFTINIEIIITEYPFGGEGKGEYLRKQMDIIHQSSPDTKPLVYGNLDYGQTVEGHDFTKFHFYTQNSALIGHKL